MRKPILAAVLVTALAPFAPAAAEEPPVIELTVGESKDLVGFRPLCDDPTVAWFVPEGGGKLKGLKVGETICSVSRGSPLGVREAFRIVVKEPPAKRPPAKRG